MRGKKIYYLFWLCFIAACHHFPQKPKPEIDYTETLVVWDTTDQKYTKLLFHTVKLENNSISGYSTVTQSTETFQLTEVSTAQFDQMRLKAGFSAHEIRCISCHISVGKLKKIN